MQSSLPPEVHARAARASSAPPPQPRAPIWRDRNIYIAAYLVDTAARIGGQITIRDAWALREFGATLWENR